MTDKHERKRMDWEIKELRDHVFYLNNILENVKEWLDQEAEGPT